MTTNRQVDEHLADLDDMCELHQSRAGFSEHNSGSAISALPPSYTTTTSEQLTDEYALQKPIVIPATAASLGSPFLRAYAPILANYHISRETFLNFIDDLNRVAVKSPPLQVLGLAGSIVGFVPLATAQIVGNSVNAASTLATIAMSKGRTEITLSEANKQLFEPRGLHVEIGKLEAVAAMAKIPNVLNVEGKIDKKSALLPYLEGSAESHNISGQQRRLEFLEPWIAHLEVDPLPEIEERTNLLSQWSVKASEAERKRQEKKLVKERRKAHEKYIEENEKADKELAKELKKLEKEEDKVRRNKSPEKAEKELRKIEKERNKVLAEHDKEVGKIDEDVLKDDKEQESIRKVLFLMIIEQRNGQV